MLVIDDLRMTIGVNIVVGYKAYTDGKITAKIRCNYGSDIANKLAETFGGGGHSYAAGFKIINGRPLEEIKKQVEAKVIELLDEKEK